MSDIALNEVTKLYGAHRAVDTLSLDLKDGEFFVLLGPTGAGKTTTLRLIAGLEAPDGGTIQIGGRDTAEMSVAERDVAMVFQYYSLYPRYDVRENLAFPLKAVRGQYSQAEIDERIAKAAKMLRIDHLLDRKTDKLSGGEMQRVSIGRAIVREPSIFLMDEPLSNLDAKLRELLRSELKELQIQLKGTFLYVTHDQIEAMSMGDRIGILEDGKIIQVGTPHEIYHSPRNTFVASFVGSPAMNLLPATVSDGTLAIDGAFDLQLTEAGRERIGGATGTITAGIRSEDVHLADEGPRAIVYHIENQGVEKIVTLKSGKSLFKATTPATRKVKVDDEVAFVWDLDRLHGFDTASGVNLREE